MAEQIAGRNKRSGYWHDRLPLRHIGGDGCKQPGGGGADGATRPQRGQGWVIPRNRYDDGGLSGGTMAHGAKAKTVSA